MLPRFWGCTVFLEPLEHPQPCSSCPVIPQVLWTGEMWLLLVALCLAQGLEGAGAIYNPERFMNIVSAGRALCFPRAVPKVLPKGPAHPFPDICTWPLWGGLGHQKSPRFALVSLTSCPQLEPGLSLLFL